MPEKEEPKTPAAKKLSGLLTRVKGMVGDLGRVHDVMGDRDFRERYRALHGGQPPKRSEVKRMRYARRPGDDSMLNQSYEPEGNELSEAKKKRITYLHGKQYPKGTHYCATHVEHADWGRGRTITTQHAKPDAYGDIDWYDVMFEHGVEKQVPTDDLNILLGEGHNNHEHHEPSGEEFVYEYLTAFFGTDLNESADDITEEHLIEAIEAINMLTGIVNEYFGLSEDVHYDFTKGKGKEQSDRFVRETGRSKSAAAAAHSDAVRAVHNNAPEDPEERSKYYDRDSHTVKTKYGLTVKVGRQKDVKKP